MSFDEESSNFKLTPEDTRDSEDLSGRESTNQVGKGSLSDHVTNLWTAKGREKRGATKISTAILEESDLETLEKTLT